MILAKLEALQFPGGGTRSVDPCIYCAAGVIKVLLLPLLVPAYDAVIAFRPPFNRLIDNFFAYD